MKRKNKKIRNAVLFYTIASIIGFLILVPFLWMISTSFKGRGNELTIPIEWIPDPISFRGYQDVFTILPFELALANTVFVAVSTTVITMLSAAMAAYAFSKLQFRGRDKLFSIYLATMMVPAQVTIIPMFIVLSQMKLVDTFGGLLLPSFFNAFATFLLRQQMRSISNDYIDAGIIDGASHFRIFRSVMLPLIAPILATLGVITFMGAWNDYFWPLVILKDRNKMTLSLALNSLNDQYSSHYNTLMAGSLVTIIPILIIYGVAQKYFKSGLQVGGLKG